ncbi:phosphotransferase enzyme family protein [Bacillus ndiopicus]|uniref:phosphotransferase enzyme family protein n=1 Tax=Bacillus ndiopicus TaxID=1347368 RepID=UPI0005AA2A41|nr:phosphotransferase [Bacillus ndiopicus]
MNDTFKKIATTFWHIEIAQCQVLRDGNKKLAAITAFDGTHYMLKGEQQNGENMQKICDFANQLSVILPVTTYLKTAEGSYIVTDHNIAYTLEHALSGIAINHLKDIHIEEIGKALGEMHRFSLEHTFTLNQATSWSMFGGNQSDAIGDYDENELSFRDFATAFAQEPQMQEIASLYMQHRQQLAAVWQELPMAATQGDFCYYNMLFNEQQQISGIFDFNLAGDEVLVNEYVAVGVYLCWSVDYQGEQSPTQRFQRFMQAYEEQRALNSLEKTAIPALFAIIRAFRYDRVDNGIKNVTSKECFLNETLEILRNSI